MPDFQGVTPLMLSARGAAPFITEMIISAIGPQGMAQMSRQERFEVMQWNNARKEELEWRFSAFEMDPGKDENACTSSFFWGSKYRFLGSPSFPEETKAIYEEVGLEVGVSYKGGQPTVGIKATRRNAQILLDYAAGHSEAAVAGRKKLSTLWWQSSDPQSGFWRYIATEMQKVEGRLSGVGHAERYLMRQAANAEVLRQSYKGRS